MDMDIDIDIIYIRYRCRYGYRYRNVYIYIYVGVAYIHPRVNAYDVDLPKYASAIGSSSQVSCNRNI